MSMPARQEPGAPLTTELAVHAADARPAHGRIESQHPATAFPARALLRLGHDGGGGMLASPVRPWPACAALGVEAGRSLDLHHATGGPRSAFRLVDDQRVHRSIFQRLGVADEDALLRAARSPP